MKLIPFSSDLCQQLLDRGYNNFVKRCNDDEESEAAFQHTITLEAVRDQSGIPIQQVMQLPQEKVNACYVMLRD